MQWYRTSAFVAYGSLNFTRPAFLKHAKQFNEHEVEADMKGVNVVVTGANAGIGKAAAEALAARGASVHLVCRNKEKGEAAVHEIQQRTGNADVQLEVCDMASLQQIRDYAKKFEESGKPLHVLVNNAGIMQQTPGQSPDGFEMNFAVNVLGVFAMTELLMPALERAAPDAKVICVATGGVLTEPLSVDLQGELMGKKDGTVMYARNKRVQLAITEKWAEVYKGRGVTFLSMHPGWVDTATLSNSMPGFYSTFKSRLRTPAEGADTIAWLAMRPAAELKQGGFYFDREAVNKHLFAGGTGHNPYQVDEIHATLRRMAGLPK